MQAVARSPAVPCDCYTMVCNAILRAMVYQCLGPRYWSEGALKGHGRWQRGGTHLEWLAEGTVVKGVGDDDRRHPNANLVVRGRGVPHSASLPPRQAVAGSASWESRSPPQRVALRGGARIAAGGWETMTKGGLTLRELSQPSRRVVAHAGEGEPVSRKCQ